jgi:uncharacterized repeat protein (TIGR04052 family)
MHLRVAKLSWALLIAVGACDDDDTSAANSGADSGSPTAGAAGKRPSSAGMSGGAGKAGAGTMQPAGESGGRSDAGAEPDDAGSDDQQAVTIRFAGKFEDRALSCADTYQLASLGDARVSPSDFRFFVQELRLVTASGKEELVVFDERSPVQTREVALIDFTGEEGHCGNGTSAQNTTITGKVPRGRYTGVIFVNGVPENVNHQDIAKGKPPLDDATMYWSWNTGYRFLLSGIDVEAADDADVDAGGSSAGSSFVHVGVAGCSGSPANGFACSRPNRNRIELSGFDPEQDVIVADLAKIFADVDLSQTLQCHGPSSPACGPAYAALGLNAGDGTARDTQSVFRVE